MLESRDARCVTLPNRNSDGGNITQVLGSSTFNLGFDAVAFLVADTRISVDCTEIPDQPRRPKMVMNYVEPQSGGDASGACNALSQYTGSFLSKSRVAEDKQPQQFIHKYRAEFDGAVGHARLATHRLKRSSDIKIFLAWMGQPHLFPQDVVTSTSDLGRTKQS